jgi:glycosyltransferase involved in cell wall biosynthesis
MKFSIITCTRNNSKWLPKHIESVNNQTYRNFEHIIIDDASTDDSIEIIKKNVNLEKTKVFLRKDRSYPVRNHILGMKQCSGDVIIHLDGDDWFFDNNVLSYLADTYKNTDCWATYGSWVHRDPKVTWSMQPHPTNNPEDIRKKKMWSFTHLRTFKKSLISAITAMDIFDDFGNVHNAAADCALLTGIYEYALKYDKVVYIKNPLVVYNSNTGENEYTTGIDYQVFVAHSTYNSPYSILKLLP